MTNPNLRLIGTAAVIAGMICGLAGVAQASRMYIGALHDAAGGEVVLTMGTELVTFVATPDTVVTLNDQPAALDELHTGDLVTVTSETGDGRFPVAVGVAARRDSP
jgi:hypothetical protein